MSHLYPTPCIHDNFKKLGEPLCEDCEQEFLEDPEAWQEYGDHPEGIARSRQLDAEIAAYAEKLKNCPIDKADPLIPF